ncbi:hypothetical protein E4T56_gene3594 [Termitomyces sp. T112]|nr:hypothetical protein E4T56_gene3594 [Termitomyces sp. T112]
MGHRISSQLLGLLLKKGSLLVDQSLLNLQSFLSARRGCHIPSVREVTGGPDMLETSIEPIPNQNHLFNALEPSMTALVNLPLASISTGPDVFSMPGIVPNNIPDEIIIAENIDTLESNFQDLFPPFSQTQLSNLPSRLESSLTMTPESFEPPRVFKSGVLSLFSAEDPSLPSSVAPSLRPSASLVPSIVETPEFSQHTDATTSLSVEREGSLFSSFHERSASCLSDSSIKISRRPSDHNTSAIETFGNSTSPCAIVPEDVSAFLPLAQHDKVRRFILFNSRSLASVSMRGSVDLIDAGSLRHQHSLNTQRPNELIDDACIVQTGDDSLVILGHARDHEQLSWCRSRCGTDKGEILFLLRPWNKNKKGGVSAVTSMMQPMQFATGGYDHTVHLWDVKSDLSGASPRTLAIKHTSHVQSLLAIRDTSHKLVSAGADCNVHIWDLSSERVVNTLRVSNIIYHLHTMTSPFCTLLEVAHRELQFEVRDHRLVPEHPVIRFGYTTDKVHGRYTKGAVSTQFFASGSKDGYVRLWDLRNAGSAATTAAICHGQKIIQVLFKEANLIICTETGQTSLFKYEY